ALRLRSQREQNGEPASFLRFQHATQRREYGMRLCIGDLARVDVVRTVASELPAAVERRAAARLDVTEFIETLVIELRMAAARAIGDGSRGHDASSRESNSVKASFAVSDDHSGVHGSAERAPISESTARMNLPIHSLMSDSK